MGKISVYDQIAIKNRKKITDGNQINVTWISI